MDQPEPTIEKFFQGFERSSAAGDVEALVRLYSASFLVAGANGVQIVKASDLRFAIPKRKQILESIGCQSTTLVSLHETKLDERYSMVRTQWRWRFKRGETVPMEITLPSTHIVQRSAEGLQIVFYLNHEDIMTVLRDRGLLP